MIERSAAEAQAFLDRAEFIWHQRFRLAADVYAPGANDVEWLAQTAALPRDLAGKTVLDVGTTNGGAAFEAERRGALRVVATDIVPPDWFGFDRLSDFLGSRVEFRQINVYELDSLAEGQFDIVIFWGVLYHLRHPLLGLDNVRSVTRELLLLETAICDQELAYDDRALPLARYYRLGELGDDSSNWFSPTIAAVLDWCRSAGLAAELVSAWPQQAPTRCMVGARPLAGDPEFARMSYERRLRCRAVPDAPDRPAGHLTN